MHLQGTVGRLLEDAIDLLVAVMNIAEREGFPVEELQEALELIEEWKNG